MGRAQVPVTPRPPQMGRAQVPVTPRPPQLSCPAAHGSVLLCENLPSLLPPQGSAIANPRCHSKPSQSSPSLPTCSALSSILLTLHGLLGTTSGFSFTLPSAHFYPNQHLNLSGPWASSSPCLLSAPQALPVSSKERPLSPHQRRGLRHWLHASITAHRKR